MRNLSAFILIFVPTWLTILLVYSAPALADDWKTMPGTACRPADFNASNITYSGTLIQNAGTSSAVIYCPMERDTHLEGDEWTNLEMYIYDASSTAVFSCNGLITEGSTHNLSTGTTKTNGFAVTTGNATLSSIVPPANSYSSDAIYQVRCSVPPGSKIFGYRYSEANTSSSNDYHLNPGSMCDSHQPWGNFTLVDKGLKNSSAYTWSTACPVLRDNTLATSLVAVVVYINDASSSESVTCSLIAWDSIGVAKSGTSTASGTSFTGVKNLSLGVATGISSPEYYQIECEVPPNSTILGYLVVED